MFLIIDEEYRVYKSPILSGYVRGQVKKSKLSVIDLRTMKGLVPSSETGDGLAWEDVQDVPLGFKVDD